MNSVKEKMLIHAHKVRYYKIKYFLGQDIPKCTEENSSMEIK